MAAVAEQLLLSSITIVVTKNLMAFVSINVAG
jgi:hypothetical protein